MSGEPATPERSRPGLVRRLAFSGLVAVATFLVCELVLSAVHSRWGARSYRVCEATGTVLQFDPRTGYRLAPDAFRLARISGGELEFLSSVQGNAQGWPDRDDAPPTRAPDGPPRVLVLGDSFTAGLHLEATWPERAEDLLAEAERPLDLLNTAQHGGGLGNWWSVLTRIVRAEHYELDGVVFAVWGDDLERPFRFAHWSSETGALFGQAPGWRPADIPADGNAARALMRRHEQVWLLPPESFEGALDGSWRPPRRWRWYLTPRVSRLVPRLVAGDGGRDGAAPWLAAGEDGPAATPKTAPAPGASATPKAAPAPGVRATLPGGADQRWLLVRDMATYLKAHRLPVLVVHIPSRELLLFGTPADDSRTAARRFAERLGAEFVDGLEAFADLDRAAVRRHWLELDVHWNQRGSDRFARWFAPRMSAWLGR